MGKCRSGCTADDSAPLPAPGETVHATGVARRAGGKGANQAVAAAALGARVWMLGAVGDDEDGTLCRRALLAAGVADDAVLTVAGSATGLGAKSCKTLNGRQHRLSRH